MSGRVQWRSIALAVTLLAGCNVILGNEQPHLRSHTSAQSQEDAATTPGVNQGVTTGAGVVGNDAGVKTNCASLVCGDYAECTTLDGVAQCRCKTGFALRDGACSDIDECAESNGGCDPHASCINLPGGRACDCESGYRHADQDETHCVDRCAEAACDLHASCTVINDLPVCTCLAPYAGNGAHCSFDQTCSTLGCDPNARCSPTEATPCSCRAGFQGDGMTCTRIDHCMSDPCQHGGRCLDADASFSCNCTGTGYRGALCEETIDECSPNPCSHGLCTDLVSGYACDCSPGFTGKNCEVDLDDCATAPCVRGACTDLVNDYKCSCPAGYGGKNCDTDTDNCAGNPCVRGTCEDRLNGYMCSCPAGYDGVNCENNIDDCASVPCVRGTCADLVNGYKCTCPAGYDGAKCEHNIDDCASKPCVRGTCSDLVNAYKCTCPAGWGGARCDTGSCSNLKCPTSAPCRVPAKNAGLCYPTECGSSVGLCMAENADGGGNASSEPLTGRNADFNFGTGNNWNNRARYFVYLNEVHGGYVCVYPQKSQGGSPLVIPLGQARSKSAGFGQSNSWPDPPTCALP